MITQLPPGPEDPELHFDLHAFKLSWKVAYGRYVGLDFTERAAIHNARGFKHPSQPPDWANSDEKLARVIRQKLKFHNKYSCGGFSSSSSRAAYKRAGGYAATIAAVVYRSWRLGYSSAQVADEMGMLAVHVRQILLLIRNLGEQFEAQGWPKKLLSSGELLCRMQRIQRTGKPEFNETIHCFFCKVRPIAPGQKWRCKECAAERNQAARRAYRKAKKSPIKPA